MVRKGPRQSLNSSIVTVTNNSIVEEDEQQQQPDYADFIKQFGLANLDDNLKLVGQKDTIDTIVLKIERLLKFKKPQFVLVTGPQGAGKTVVLRKLAQQYGEKLNFFYLLTSWTQDKRFGVPESRIGSLFNEAIKKAPSVILLDEMDLICAEKQNDAKERVINAIQNQLFNLKTLSAQVMVIFSTDKPELLRSHVKRRYLATEIRFQFPTTNDRQEIIQHILRSIEHNITMEQFEQIAKFSHCYSYEDLEELVGLGLELSGSETLTFEHLHRARLGHKPVAVQSVITPCLPLKWQDIGGVEEAKSELQKKVIQSISFRADLHKMGSRFKKKGCLLYGPPGCSKTMLAQALATESGYNFISIKGSEVFNKYVGESEAKVRTIYRNAREIAPCIIFFDEIDAMAPERCNNQNSNVDSKVVAALLTELNGIEALDNVFTIAATNRPDRVDKALLRPGRLSPHIYVPLPSESDRREILNVCLKDVMLEDKESLLGPLAELTAGYSGAEIDSVCEEAISIAFNEFLKPQNIEWNHFEKALEKVRPSTSKELLKIYENFGEIPRQEQDKQRKISTSSSSSSTSSLSESLKIRHKKSTLNRLMNSLRIKAKR